MVTKKRYHGKVHLMMIETGGFLRITSEIGIESQQTLYLWTPWAKWSSAVLFVSGPGLMLRFGVPARKFDFFPKSQIRNVNTGLDSPRHGEFKNVWELGGENRIAGRRVEKRGAIVVRNGQNLPS